ncbi:MAG: c-type cytochrome [Burkholderiales bacterium]|nr:c-type cytochrome [Burkholderiales bacterium]
MFFALLVSLVTPGLADAQAAKARAAADVDLVARLKEVLASPAQLEAMVKSGAKVASFCANCHGDGGNSVKPNVPNLAGQNPGYLLEQMRQFMDGRRRDTDFKQRLIKVLSPDEKIGLNLYYAQQSVAHKPPTNVALAARGKVVYKNECAECHEDDGHGTEKFARIAGQQTGYLTRTLTAYRDGSSARTNRQMITSIRGMSDADIAAVVAYTASMR